MLFLNLIQMINEEGDKSKIVDWVLIKRKKEWCIPLFSFECLHWSSKNVTTGSHFKRLLLGLFLR